VKRKQQPKPKPRIKQLKGLGRFIDLRLLYLVYLFCFFCFYFSLFFSPKAVVSLEDRWDWGVWLFCGRLHLPISPHWWGGDIKGVCYFCGFVCVLLRVLPLGGGGRLGVVFGVKKISPQCGGGEFWGFFSVGGGGCDFCFGL